MLQATNFNPAAKTLHVNSPSKAISNGVHSAKIVSGDAQVFVVDTKKGDKLQIVSVKTQIEGFPAFMSAIVSEEVAPFIANKNVGDIVQVSITTNEKGYQTASI